MNDTLPWWNMALRVLAAVLGAALVGYERSSAGKPAGLRTHILVGLGSAMFTLSAVELSLRAGGSGVLGTDASRVIQGIVGGLGFLGAGAILQGSHGVTGITTAASVWVVGALGVVCGLGFFQLALTSVVVALGTLSILGFLEKRVLKLGNRQPDDS